MTHPLLERDRTPVAARCRLLALGLLGLLAVACGQYPSLTARRTANAGGSGGEVAPGVGGHETGGGGIAWGSCRPLPRPVVVLVSSGDTAPSGAFPAIVREHRTVDPEELPPSARGADRLLSIEEIRDAAVERRLYYRVSAGMEAPVQPGDEVRLYFQEELRDGRSAAAVVRDTRGMLRWAVLDGWAGELSLTTNVARLGSSGVASCALEGCGPYARVVRASVSGPGDSLELEPGQRKDVDGGKFELAEYMKLKNRYCDGPRTRAAWTYVAGPRECGAGYTPECDENEFCSYPDHACGTGARKGTCLLGGVTCNASSASCACFGLAYPNECLAQAAGSDLSVGCEPPEGTFACGPYFCLRGVEYCERTMADGVDSISGHLCRTLPPCTASGCACLEAAQCGRACTEDRAGNLTVTCAD